MFQMRKCVFETNSSSTHSVCITTNRNTTLCFQNHVNFRCGDFGWEWKRLDTVEDKAAYLYSSMLCLFDKKEVQRATTKITDMLYRFGITCSFEEPGYVDYGGCFQYCENASIDHSGDGDHQEES